MKPVAIVGGGLAGLACARALQDDGVEYLLFEATDRVGGRLKTDVIDGMLVDRGFQVHFDAYPHADRVLDQKALDLRPFRAGAMIREGARWHLIDRAKPFATLRSGAFGLADKIRTALFTLRTMRATDEEIRSMPDLSTEDDLRELGFSDRYVDRFCRPFLGGIFLDRSLSTSRRQFRWVWKYLASGRTVLPANGIEAIPRQLVSRLESHRVLTDAPVASVGPDGVRLTSGEFFPSSRVVMAADYARAARLTGLPVPQGRRASTQIVFETDRPPFEGGYIGLNGDGGLVNTICPITNVAPYAPRGRHLLSVSVLEPDADVALVERELREWPCDLGSLRLVAKHSIPDAQMAQPPGFDRLLARSSEERSWLRFAGEVTSDSSIDGAIASGLRAAR